MELDGREMEGLASRTGFAPAVLEKVVRLADLLLEFGRHPLLREALLLKGGTPLNLAFGPPRRLSVDLDFNYVGAEDRGAMLSARPEIEGAIRRIAGVRTYAVQQSADEHAGRKLYLGYRNAAGVADRIEVDINYLHRMLLAAPVEATTLAAR